MLLAPTALGATVTGLVQSDGGPPGDAPDTFGAARELPGAGRYEGTVLTVEDPFDVYAIRVDGDTLLRAAVTATGDANVEILDPDGVAIPGGRRADAQVYTDKAGLWRLRVAGLGARYALDVAVTPFPQDDGGTGRDAGWRDASALVLPRNVSMFGNLTPSKGDCQDRWLVPVVAGERIQARFQWTGAGVTVAESLPGLTGREVKTLGPYWQVNATATRNATWAFTPQYALSAGNRCSGVGTEYRAFVTWIPLPGDPPPPPPPPPDSSPPEVTSVAPAGSRPGRLVQLFGHNLSGASVRMGSLAAQVYSYDTNGGWIKAYVPLLPPGEHDVVATTEDGNGTLSGGFRVLAPADLAVVAVTSRAHEEGVHVEPQTGDRVVRVDVRNLEGNLSEGYVLSVRVVPRGLPAVPGTSTELPRQTGGALGPDAMRVHTFRWDARGAVGGFDIAVTLAHAAGAPPSYYDASAANDVGSGRDWIVVDGSAGVRRP